MSPRDDLERAISLLRDGPVALPDVSEQTARRRRILPAMRQLVVRTPGRLQRSRARRTAWLLTIALASVATSWLLLARPHGQRSTQSFDRLVVQLDQGRQATWTDGQTRLQLLGTRTELPVRGKLQSFHATYLTLSTPSGVWLELHPHSQVALSDLVNHRRAILSLEAGKVRCRVSASEPSAVFAVRTRSGEVVVHGAVFSVETPHDDPDQLCVRVEEGLVEVRHGDQYRMLEGGRSYGCRELSSVEPGSTPPPLIANATADPLRSLDGS